MELIVGRKEGRQGGLYRGARGDTEGGLSVSSNTPDLVDAASNGLLFSASNGTARAPGTAISTTAAIGVWNPPENPYDAVLVQAFMAWASGTLGAGNLWFCLHPAIAAPTGTAIVIAAHYGGGNGDGTIRAYENLSSLATGIGISPIREVGAATANPGSLGSSALIPLRGEFPIPPGYVGSLIEVGAAGTSPTAFFTMTWQKRFRR